MIDRARGPRAIVALGITIKMEEADLVLKQAWRRAVVAVGVVATLVGCAVPQHYIECEDDTSCGLASGGRCLVNIDTSHRFCAYPDSTCARGMRWSALDVESSISGTCVSVDVPDAGVDGRPDAPFDAGGFDARTGLDAPTAKDAAAPDAATQCTPTEKVCLDTITLQTCDTSGTTVRLCVDGCTVDHCNACMPNAYACQDQETSQHCNATATAYTFVNCQAAFSVNCNPQTGYCFGHTPP